MRPSIDHRAVRARVLVGALSATCAFTVNVPGVHAKSDPVSVVNARAQTLMLSVRWIPGDVAAASHLLPRRRRRVDRSRAVIQRMLHGGDRIAKLPYTWGGGHGSFDASGYDCSGSVSYVLHAGGLLDTPLDSSGLEGFGLPGPGRHVTIYANAQHALMVIDGRRFDTIALQETGTRWSSTLGATDGYTVRHPAGL